MSNKKDEIDFSAVNLFLIRIILSGEAYYSNKGFTWDYTGKSK